MSVHGVVLGSGSGRRFGGAKQFADLAGRTLLEHSAASALAGGCDAVVCVVPDPDDPRVPAALRDDGRVTVVRGGGHRAQSVRAGLAVVPDSCTVVVLADAAHPLASPSLVAAVVAAVRAGADGALPGLPLTEVLATVEDLAVDGTDGPPRPGDGTVRVRTGGLPREGHVLVQTPFAFRADVLRAAHADALARGVDTVEDTAMVAALPVDGRLARIVVVPGEPANLHVTTAEELDLARRWASGAGS